MSRRCKSAKVSWMMSGKASRIYVAWSLYALEQLGTAALQQQSQGGPSKKSLPVGFSTMTSYTEAVMDVR